MTIQIRRVYEPRQSGDGHRVLVDRLWPRGVSKELATWDEWLKTVAPSGELRRWYGHLPERFREFCRRYRGELDDDVHSEALDHLRDWEQRGVLTLLTASRDVAASHVPTLEEKLRSRA
ncbi:MAG: DUF488 domain-containing protein [Stackebrandtia sp.]